MSVDQVVLSTLQIQQLLDEAYKSRVNDLDRSIALANQALAASKEIGDSQMIGKSLGQLSLFHMIIGDFDLSINIANEAIEKFQEAGDEKGIADAKYTIAGAHYKTDDYNQGLTYLVDCLITYNKFGDYHNQARVHKSMGTIYEYFGDEKSAIQSYQEAVKSGEKANDLNLQSNAFNPLSGILLNNGKTKEALELIEKSITWKKETKDIRGLAFALYGRGKIFTKTDAFEDAERDLLESIEIHEKMGEKLGRAMSFHKLGALYLKMGRLEEAKKTLIEALEYSNKNKIILIKFKANLLLHEIAKMENDFELALKYMTQYVHEKESVINNRTAKVIESYDVIHRMQNLEQEALVQKEKADLIEKKNIELDSFFYRVSHDLKGPITAMLSLNYLAKQDIEDETAKKYFEENATQANRINSILEELMNLTKLVYGSRDVKQEIDFKKLIQDCVSSFKHLPNFDSITFGIEVEENIRYEAEWVLVNTIIQNLIENGIKYARVEDNDPEIKIAISTDSQQLVIAVSDNGIGMNEDAQSKIFKMFYRANRKIEGTGLGLHIVNRALEKLNGNVELKSELGNGSEFKVLLPIELN